jgi:hypothetical protein
MAPLYYFQLFSIFILKYKLFLVEELVIHLFVLSLFTHMAMQVSYTLSIPYQGRANAEGRYSSAVFKMGLRYIEHFQLLRNNDNMNNLKAY